MTVAKLTRQAQVVDVLLDGGVVRSGGRGGRLRLEDKDGHDVRAWQQAIRGGLEVYNAAPAEVIDSLRQKRAARAKAAMSKQEEHS